MIIENINLHNHKTTKKAALFYKTEPFFVNVNDYTHTNNWEILQSIRILNSQGYSVDLLDRNLRTWKPKSSYELFLGLGVGNSGQNFVKWATASKADKKVLLSMGPQPDISNELVLKRYKMFEKRTGSSTPPMRTVEKVTGENFIDIINNTDYIFNIGEKNNNSYNSYLKYNKPIINFFPSISPSVKFDDKWRNTRDRNSFLCFAGNGFICKGVDLVLEAFLKNPKKELHICGPNTEKSFFRYYEEKIKNAPNIYFHGFIKPGGEIFNRLSSRCSFVIFHSSAEGCCTSVATAMKSGLVPIINSWTGINISKEGINMKEDGNLIQIILDAVEISSNLPNSDYQSMIDYTLEKSKLFSQKSFITSYFNAIKTVIGEF